MRHPNKVNARLVGFEVVPSNDWALMAKITAQPPEQRKKLYAAINAMF